MLRFGVLTLASAALGLGFGLEASLLLRDTFQSAQVVTADLVRSGMVPEPTAVGLLATGLLGLIWSGSRASR